MILKEGGFHAVVMLCIRPKTVAAFDVFYPEISTCIVTPNSPQAGSIPAQTQVALASETL